MQNLKLSIIQADLAWEDSRENLKRFDAKISGINLPTDLIVLPEMFNTGFTMHAEKCAEEEDEPTMQWLKEKAGNLSCIVAGSILIKEEGNYYNRFVWMRPDGTYDHYDKRHRFSMVGEHKVMSAGNSRKIVELKGWKINLQVCYDLRFPVWSKNTFGEGEYAYDLLVYIANWPEVRKGAYTKLLPARAIENQSYVVWVNRVGNDANGIYHSGDSGVYDLIGHQIASTEPGSEGVVQVSLSAEHLLNQRSKFRFGPDWDTFSIDV